ncbi:MAG: hypothetical protein GEU80_10075 [Dehalococcoidia bacterium]|nr:hypothetical protein [Dehalococcoidia bacterium]
MSDLLSIWKLTEDDVRQVVRTALTRGLDSARIADFVASVDWSHTIDRRPAIADLLGELEAWEHEYTEGDSSKREYIERLLTLLPEGERAAARERALSAA